ncbi:MULTISPECIES: efflux RND transporter periplasmic adaptor subunit [unclassified Variovorax]|jgi:membrane fusion protein (multidrug efflux system)|uniref:efflux RND transporter periplasmic adaptor subunit n=1 Tax=unclassified Variovorax TaxID=663243 RepID=UPI000F7D973F|nr:MULTISPECIES: efflux RND transporter periplasmic adaptor subunit [unclassified Variovorax]RSZ30172.1 efflux RND transporter periplasmic adaptor subunit [Variovorax sp. 553]RSZ30707.1 efflux RND transporter periplasmic adaptor subunit [Variovorax sp. 679]
MTFKLLFPLSLLVLAACGARQAPDTDAAPPEVGVMALHASDVPVHTELSGRTAAFRVSEVRPQVNGIVRKRLFEEGSMVRAGQVLYEIEPGPFEAAHEQAQATLATAQASIASLRGKSERFSELVKANAVSRQEHEEAQAALVQAEAGVKAAQAALKAARINLEFTRIAAPISGRIGRSSVTEGALVAPGQATELATIQRIDPIYVDVVQSSLELTRLKRRFISGDMAPASTRVSLRMEDGLPYPHAGTLKFTEVAVDAATGSVTLRAEFPNPQGLLLPGMYVRAQVESGVERQAVLAPQRGVSRNEKGEPTALVIGAGDKVELRALEVRSAAGDQWIVTGGLREGDRLVVDGLQRAHPGDKVTPVPVSAAATPSSAD